ncbi:hypothetical protein D3C72_998070 [compost metagenome]
MEVLVLGEQLLHLGVGLVDILRVARQRHPAERALAAAEQRADIGRHEAREIERVLHALVESHLADVVAVVQRRHAHLLEGQHRLHMLDDGRARGGFHRLRVALAQVFPLRHGPAFGQVAVDEVMRRSLVGDDVRAHAAGLGAARQLRHDLCRVAEQAHRDGLLLRGGVGDHGQRLVQRGGLLVHIARAQAEVDARLLALDGQHAGPGQHASQRLRAAHATQPGRQDPLAGEVATEVLVAGLDEGLEGALHDALRADIDPRAGGHLAVHHQSGAVQLIELVPVGPVRHEVGVGDQHARRVSVRAENAHRLA